jgi:DNA modification methylase
VSSARNNIAKRKLLHKPLKGNSLKVLDKIADESCRLVVTSPPYNIGKEYERPHSALAGQTPAAAYGTGRPVDMMDKATALPTSPQAQQQKQDVLNRILAA